MHGAWIHCDPCRTRHWCPTNHGPDGHGGSSICCPVGRARLAANARVLRRGLEEAQRRWGEAGRSVHPDTGRITYAWPPEGRFADLWDRLAAAIPTDTEKCEALALLKRWQQATSTLVAYTDAEGTWHDVTPDHEEPERWLRQARAKS